MSKHNLLKRFHCSPEIIRLAGMVYIRFPLSQRNVEDLLHERGIDVSHEAVRFWLYRFGPIFAAVLSSVHNHVNRDSASPAGKFSSTIATPLSKSGGSSARPEACRSSAT